MPLQTTTATTNYQNWQFIAEDVFALGGYVTTSNFSNVVYGVANYPNWQVLTVTTLVTTNIISANILSAAFNIRITRPLVLTDIKTPKISIEGIFTDEVRYPFYDSLSDVFIKPEDGVSELSTETTTEVTPNANCNS